MVTSAIIVEGLFGLPGLGTVLNNAIRSNDFPTIYGIVLFITIANRGADDDPRVRLSAARPARA